MHMFMTSQLAFKYTCEKNKLYDFSALNFNYLKSMSFQLFLENHRAKFVWKPYLLLTLQLKKFQFKQIYLM